MSAMQHREWKAEAVRRFGEDSERWAFVCPVCKYVATIADWRAAGAPDGAIAFSCVGRWRAVKGAAGPCNYAGGGLFQLNPVTVVDSDGEAHSVFSFADAVLR